jgi:hypothetical protein
LKEEKKKSIFLGGFLENEFNSTVLWLRIFLLSISFTHPYYNLFLKYKQDGNRRLKWGLRGPQTHFM